MANIAETIFTVVAETVESLASALVSTATNLFTVTVGGETTLTTLAIIILSFVGISIGFTVITWVLGLVKLN